MDMTKEEDNNNKMEENGDTEQNGDSGDSDLELDCGDGDLLLCHTHQGNKGHKSFFTCARIHFVYAEVIVPLVEMIMWPRL